jgi:hypothetical protein
MSTSAWRSAADRSAYSEFEDQLAAARWEVAPDERVGPPLARRGLRRAIRGGILLLAAGVAGWAYTDDTARPILLGAISTARTTIGTVMERQLPQVTPPGQVPGLSPGSAPAAETARSSGRGPEPAGAEIARAVSPPAAEVEHRTPPVDVVTPRSPQIAAAAVPPAAAAYEAEPAAAAAAQARLSPHQKRAQAAGLHPDLSRVLIEKLSETDLRNATTAIETALAETHDDDVLYWPKQPKAGIAHYQIHFVPGAEAGCRRYVVTIAKAGWLTTALPMEKCGVVRKAAAKAAAAEAATR